jgi:serine beta-lactamase-like protein LACTB, mitochondrial
VAVRGQVVWHEGLGYANPNAGIPACPDTQFRAASVSKLFTAAAMARLIDAGRLDPDVPIQRYVPSFPEKGEPITSRLLAEHRAGIRAYRNDLEAINHIEFRSATDSLAQFSDDPLVAVPGTRFVYSNYGYVLLSAVIEGASGEDFLSDVRQNVFRPLGMTSTTEDRSGANLPRRASFYDNVTPYSFDGRRVPSPPNNFSGRWASGGFLSTVDDLLRFGSAHVRYPGSGFLSDRTLQLLMRPQSGLPPIAGYGLGWMTAYDLHGRLVRFHFGAGSGATALLAIWPNQQVALAIMGNLGQARLPFNRLAAMANTFLSGPKWDQIAGIAAICAVAMISISRLRMSPAGRRRAAPVSNSSCM